MLHFFSLSQILKLLSGAKKSTSLLRNLGTEICGISYSFTEGAGCLKPISCPSNTHSTWRKKWWLLLSNTVCPCEAEMAHGDVTRPRAVCIPCTLDLVAELKLCCVGLVSRMSAEQRILPFLVLHLCCMIEIHGLRCREHCWRECPSPSNPGFSVQAKVTGIGEISSALNKWVFQCCAWRFTGRTWVHFYIVGFEQAVRSH